MLSDQRILIVGAGFSGTLLAINLLRHDGPRAILVEREPGRVARGIAYGTDRPEHVLNVRATNMSAFPDQPAHFTDWLARNGIAGGFVPRRVYGRYLSETLQHAMQQSPGRLEIVAGNVVALDDGEPLRARLADGNIIEADAVVLAPGNLPPHDLPDVSGLTDAVYRPDPWAPGALEGLATDAHVLLIGTGLTAVDAALTLDANGFRGRILALSRRGLAPRQHVDGALPPAAIDAPEASCWRLLRRVRERAAEVGWRTAVDELRPHTQNLWRRASVEEQARFLRHLRPWWDVHRHRIAPQVAERLAALQAEGRLDFVAGRICSARESDGVAEIAWRERHSGEIRTLRAARVINCTGPQGDLLRSSEPLLVGLVERGIIRPDPLQIGIEVDRQSRVIARSSIPSETIFAFGPMTRGAFWEIVAVPDLRQQAWDLARRLSASHWVGGEGL